MQSKQLMVSIQCCVYNQEKYIRQCLDGLVRQNTNFRFEAIVHDDASTDSSATIIREYAAKYPDIIKPILETENQYSKKDGTLGRIMDEASNGKYIAFCEGDDYWTDPGKLQKQVDFMEAHPEYSMCFTDVQNYYEDGQRFGERQSEEYADSNSKLEGASKIYYTAKDKENVFFSILNNRCRIQTLSVLVRSVFYKQRGKVPLRFMMGDTPLWLDLSQMGPIKYIPECMGVYRINKGSVCRDSSTTYLFQHSMFEMRVYYCLKYKYTIPQRIKCLYNKALTNLYIHNLPINQETIEPFSMGRIQSFFFNKAKSSRRYDKIIQLIWKCEIVKNKIFSKL